MNTEIVLNRTYGGYGLSQQARELYKQLSGKHFNYDINRYDKHLVQVVKMLGDDADDEFSKLEIVSFKGCKYRIIEYDGKELLETPDNIKWEYVNTEKCQKEYPEYFI